MKKYRKLQIAAVLLFSSIYTSLTFAAKCESFASLERIEGLVQVTVASSPFPLRHFELPYALCADDKIQTVAKAQALISHVGGDVVLAENSRLEVLSADSLSLAEGTALFKIAQREGQRFIAQTPLVVIGVKGTEFLVSSQTGRNDVALFTGGVEVERQDGQSMAYFRTKSVAEMDFKEYKAYQKKSFGQYTASLETSFSDYKAQQMARFQAYVKGVDLKAGRQLTLGGEDEQPEVVDAPINKAVEQLQQQLNLWLQ